MIPLAIAGAVAQTGANIVQAQQNNANTLALAEKNYEYGEKAANNAMERTLSLYNKIDSPQAKVEQIKRAGLSPGLLLGGGGVSGSTAGGPQGTGSSGMNPIPLTLETMEGALIGAQIKKTNEEARSEEIDNNAKEENAKNVYDAQYQKIVGENEARRLQNSILKFDEDMKRIDNHYYQENAILRLEQQKEILRQQRLENDFTEEVWDAKVKEQNQRVAQLGEAIIAQQFQNSLNAEQREGLMKIFNESVTQTELETKIKEWEKEIKRNEGQVAKNAADARETPGTISKIANGMETCIKRLTNLLPLKIG